VDESAIRADVDAVRALYQEKGFYEAKITYRVDYDARQNRASLVITIDEGTKVKVKKMVFEGVKSLKEGEIKKKIQTRTDGWFVSGLLKQDVLDLDVQRIVAFYDDNGYSDAKVSYRLESFPGGQPGDTTLVFVVEEGRQYLVGDVEVKGNTVFTKDEIVAKLDMAPGKPFSKRGLRQSVTNIQDLYFEKGYLNAKILFDSFYNEKTGKVDTSYTVTENQVAVVNRIRIEGNTKTKDIVVRRELRVYPGEPFNGAELKRSKERLFNLGYFEEVSFDIEDTSDPNAKDLVVNVKEAKTGEFSFGGGFSSIDKILGFVQIRQRNFDAFKWPEFTGAGQDLRLRAEVSEIRTNGELSWTDPWFLGNPFSLGFDLYRREFDRTRSSGLFFDETRTGAAVRVGKDITDWDRLNFTYRFDNVEIEDIPEDASADLKAEEGESDISSGFLGYTRDTRNNKFVPSSGYLLSGGYEYAGGFFGGDKDFWKATGLAAAYFKHFDFLVLELKFRGGIADAFDETPKVPIFERFFVGGANTVRGYRERRIGPRDPGTKDPIGGDTYWVTNAEYTFPIYPNVLKGAVFYDVGAAYLEGSDIGDGDVASGVGVGVRIKTPIGPVKLDVGYPLDEIEGEDKEFRFHFNISQGF
jgi:outer membrane protein insertion porin family